MTASVWTRAALAEELEQRATAAWRRWEPFYGPLSGPLLGGIKPFHKRVGLMITTLGAALLAINPAWDVHLDLDNNDLPTTLWVQKGGQMIEVPLVVDGRKMRICSLGRGEREGPSVGLTTPGAGARLLRGLAQAVVPVLVPPTPEPVHV